MTNSSTPRLQVKNWSEFQHYKQRRPPWIKLHRQFLDDYKFSRLPDASRALAPCIWLLASESEDGSISACPNELAFRFRCSVPWLVAAITPLIEGGYVSGVLLASNMLATCKRDACLETETETETETEEERENGHADASASVPKKRKAVTVTPGNGKGHETRLTPYGEAWMERWGAESKPPYGEMARAMKEAEEQVGPMEAVARWRRFLAATERAEWARPARFTQGLGQWAEGSASTIGHRLTREESIAEKNRQTFARLMAKGEQ